MVYVYNRKCKLIDKGSDDMTDTLKSLRVSSGFTQKALANKVGVSPITVFQWEHGKYKPTPSVMPKLAEVLGVTPKHLFFIINNK